MVEQAERIAFDDGITAVLDSGHIGSRNRFMVYWGGFVAMGDNEFATLDDAVAWSKWALKHETLLDRMCERGEYHPLDGIVQLKK